MEPLKAEGQRSPRWAVWKRLSLATQEGVVYLDRLRLVQTPWFGVYLHWIRTPDPDLDPHDHPWTFWSFVVRGAYEEMKWPFPSVSMQQRQPWRYRRWSRHRMDKFSAHYITAVEPNTVTLVVVGPRTRNWGFWTPSGFMPWQQYEEQDGAKQVFGERSGS